MHQVAELPADHGVAGQREVDGVGPEGGGAALLVGSQDDICPAVKETPKYESNRGGRLHKRSLNLSIHLPIVAPNCLLTGSILSWLEQSSSFLQPWGSCRFSPSCHYDVIMKFLTSLFRLSLHYPSVIGLSLSTDTCQHTPNTSCPPCQLLAEEARRWSQGCMILLSFKNDNKGYCAHISPWVVFRQRWRFCWCCGAKRHKKGSVRNRLQQPASQDFDKHTALQD